MAYDFDPRTNRENLNSKSYPRRLLEDILTNKIVDSMSFGTASNYFTRSYGPNHRVIYEGVGRLLSELLVDTLDNLEDVEYTQLRAEFVATRLMYLVFPDEESVPVGDTHEETISFLLQTYESLLQGATKKSIDEVLNDIAEGNAIVLSTIEGYIANIKSSILATTEYNTDGVFAQHRHFAFTDESGLGSTNKPIEYKWGDELHTHDIIDGVIQPYIDVDGKSHTHNVYLGIPENIVRLQSNLRKVFTSTKPAHIKTGEVASIIDEDNPILTKGKSDVFSPLLGIDSAKTDGEIIEDNKIDPLLPYYNQNAQYGLVGLSVGSLYQEEMRKAREGVYENEFYGYAIGNEVRVWRTNIQVSDSIVIPYEEGGETKSQKLRVISKTNNNTPSDGIYDSIVDAEGNSYTYKTIRDLRRGTDAEDHRIQTVESLEVINSVLYPTADVFGVYGDIGRTELLNDGEPVLFQTELYFCTKLSNDYDSHQLPDVNLAGNRIKFSYTSIKVNAQIKAQGLVLLRNTSSPWVKRDTVEYETVEFTYEAQDPNLWVAPYNWAINLPSYIVKSMLKLNKGLPVSMADLTLKINGGDIDYSDHMLSLEHTNTYIPFNTNQQTYDSQALLRIYDFKYNILGALNYTPLIQVGDVVSITYPKAKSEIRRFRELNNLEMTLNATRPTRKVSESGRGIGQNRVIETTSPISYVLNEPQPISPFTQEQKIATYSAGSSDLLNTSNQTLNTTYTLNNFSLNQTATQEQVFKPASKTLTTSNPIVSFYELGFRPSYITSVVDSEDTSYAYTLNQDHVLVSDLSSEKTLTISGISSNPFSADLDWYKGDKLGEGAAFYKHTSTVNEVNGEVNVDLGAFTESTPEEYMTNPLGLAPDQIRSVYSMLDTQTSGIEGEMTFYEDEVTGYDLDGRDGFTNEYNPHCPQDEVLYPDPTLYVLGPIPTGTTGETINTIPTYLFFGYFMLLDLDLDLDIVYYLSIYRIDANGDKQYQTLSPIQDPNGDDALQISGTLPESNGSPLAYRFLGDNGFGSLEYNQMSSTAYANISFNHIPNETYYIEVFFEQAPGGGASFMGFFSNGSNSNVAMSDSWFNLSQDPNQTEVEFLGQGGIGTTETYEVTFTDNPGGGEIDTISNIADPDANATKSTENVGLTHDTTITTYSANDYYPIRPLEYDYGYKRLFSEN